MRVKQVTEEKAVIVQQDYNDRGMSQKKRGVSGAPRTV